MARFLVDAQLPPALARFITDSGHAAEHVEDAGLLRAEDGPIWDHAISTAAAIVSKDEDFADRRLLEGSGPQIVWLRVGNCSNQALIRWLAPLWPDITLRIANGEAVVEVV